MPRGWEMASRGDLAGRAEALDLARREVRLWGGAMVVVVCVVGGGGGAAGKRDLEIPEILWALAGTKAARKFRRGSISLSLLDRQW